ncbi:hypothetical protein BGW36DRAFT_464854 [Talaromyces proteolyticus]|uniref:Enoyl reductase (ER) domain-containing protein n=1 Tax=Talaromyces proteolyticus TaxID=1131652 RepID=A0AAD4KP68_9EURO|nr:uncharacterized protein BGW36DRAFT_464854 [Talaromyces proteolyticus]KAH8692360.1 hypothetical protein BGW36DRAFT_464854 [Talaromyces proteolyticus]
MRIAQVTEWCQAPKCFEYEAPDIPAPDSGYVQVKVLATGLHQLVRLRVNGRHYSAKSLPHNLGVDGVGITSEGQEVYFFTYYGETGSFTEVINVPKEDVIPLPSKSLDKFQVAALVNPTMSSWMALRRRALMTTNSNPPRPGFSVLIMGVTSLSGTLAVDVSRALGATRVIGCGRDEKRLASLALDERICLSNPIEETDFSSVGDVHVILDYVYGPPTMALFQSLKSTVPVQYVQIGDLASKLLTLPSYTVRSRNLTITGSGLGSFSFNELREELPEMLKVMENFLPQKLDVFPMSKIESVWEAKGDRRMVFVPGF